MSTLFNWTNLNSSNIDIWVAPYDNWHLKEENFDMKLINTTWNITDYNTSHIDIQLLFNSAPNISPTQTWDSIVVNFLNTGLEIVVSQNRY